uniref:PX domain-containing protein n=1 Tax=Macrostomum lignano TaxID=282301 RepID=A0A1I8F4Z0_9PLAT
TSSSSNVLPGTADPPAGLPGPGASNLLPPLTLFECTLSNLTLLIDRMPLKDVVTCMRLIGQVYLHASRPSIIPIAKRRCRKRPHRQQQQQRPSTDAQHLDDEQLSVEDDSSTVGVDSSLNNCLAVAADQLLHIQHPIKIQQQQQPPTSQKKQQRQIQLTVMPRRQLDLSSPSSQPPPPSDVVDAGEMPLSANCQRQEQPTTAKKIWAARASTVRCFGSILSMPTVAGEEVVASVGGGGGGSSGSARFWQVRPADGTLRSLGLGCCDGDGREASLTDSFLAAMKDIFRRLKDIGSNERARRFTSRMKKLRRRQKAASYLSRTLETQEAAKLEELLQREFVSSEDEDDDRKQVRVRSLAWESCEARQLKQLLDDFYFQRIATPAQRRRAGDWARRAAAAATAVSAAAAAANAAAGSYS